MEVWIEKYRPADLFDVVGNGPVMDKLRLMAQDGNMPNLILAGPPGCGKTTSVLALARHLLKDKYSRDTVLELNASDDRGIEVVRSTIKSFAQQTSSLPAGCHKLVILDEADSMTEAAQQAMRRIMELYSHSTRFALACNTSSKIIEPIQGLQPAEIIQRVQSVVRLIVFRAESVAITDDGLEALVFTAEGDMRTALNNLQSTYNGFGVVNRANVFKVCDQPQPHLLRTVLSACVRQDWNAGYAVLQALVCRGYAIGDIVGVLLRVLKQSSTDIREDVKLEYIKEISIFQLRVVEGVASLVQLGGLVADLCLVSSRAGMPEGKVTLPVLDPVTDGVATAPVAAGA